MEKESVNINSEPTYIKKEPGINTWVTILLYLLAGFVFLIVLSGISSFISWLIPDGPNKVVIGSFIDITVMLISVLVPAVLFTRYVDNQPISMLGLSIKGRGRDMIYGILLAIVIYIIGFGISLALGAVEVISVSFDFNILLVSLIFFLIAAFVEEVMIRGYILGRLLLKVNKFVALTVSSLIFALLHIFNPNMGVLAMINLFLAGMLFGVYCLYVRNLWFPTFLHAFWNWIQGPVLGYEVSGTELFPPAIDLNLIASNFITGGKFGFEGSILCTIILIAVILLMVFWFEKRKPHHTDLQL